MSPGSQQPVTSIPRSSARAPEITRSRSAASRADSAARCSTACSSASARPTAPAASSVPLRMSRSWPPPCDNGIGRRSRATWSAPTPTGPPSLWALTAARSTPAAPRSTGRCATAWTASVWKRTPRSRQPAAMVATSCTVPTSLLAHMTVTSATDPGSSSTAARTSCAATSPHGPGSTQVTSASPASTRAVTGSRTAWCSTPLATIRRCAGSCAAAAHSVPLTARLSDSVPPEVRTISLGRDPRHAAMRSRASSTTARAARPLVCSDEGLPTAPIVSAIASTTCGRTGVVAAWSR